MVWDINAPYVAESKKIVWEVAPHLRGKGLDIGAGDFKVLPHVISVDNMNHAQFGFSVRPDVMSEADDLRVFADGSMDFVYSSHTLEHMHDLHKTLREWWRVVRPGGKLILYLPHDQLYPKVGQPGANPDHKHDLNNEKIIKIMEQVGSWDLLENQTRNGGSEYSFLQVFVKQRGKGHHTYSCDAPKPPKSVLVCRFGAFGDMMQASSVLAGLKAQGYHVTLMTSQPGADVLRTDPNIDAWMMLDKDQVPNGDLVNFWQWQAEKYDKFVNLSETVEGTLLALKGRAQHGWNPAAREKILNFNYLEFQHAVAGLPHIPRVKFYPTEEEAKWARKVRDKCSGPLIVWSLAGSAVHKTWPYLDNILAAILVPEHFPRAQIHLVGGPECKMLEAGWEKEPRVHKCCGVYSIRESLALAQVADLVIGPETGVLNAVSQEPNAKIVFLSHSTEENLTRDWVDTVSLTSKNTKCKGRGNNEAAACHMLHYGWEHCTRGERTGVAACQEEISPDECFNAVYNVLKTVANKAA